MYEQAEVGLRLFFFAHTVLQVIIVVLFIFWVGYTKGVARGNSVSLASLVVSLGSGIVLEPDKRLFMGIFRAFWSTS